MEIGNRGKKTTREGKNFVVAARNQSKQGGVLTVPLRPFGGGEDLLSLLLLGPEIARPDAPSKGCQVVIVESAADARILRNSEATERVHRRGGGTLVPLQRKIGQAVRWAEE
jgi:hypothetical protein